MDKKLDLVLVHKDVADIFIDFGTGTSIFSGLLVRQTEDDTEVFNVFTKDDVDLPKIRYDLSTEEGQQELLDDLEELGLAGHHYHIRDAFKDAKSFGTGDEDLEKALLRYYEENINLGWFFDLVSLKNAVARLQFESDREAKAILEAFGYSPKLSGGPCYLNHVWCDDTEDKVEF